MSYQGSWNRLAVTLQHGRQVMPCSVLPPSGRVRGVCGCQGGGHRKKPSNLSFEEAASVPVASQTAWQGIFTHGHLERAIIYLPDTLC